MSEAHAMLAVRQGELVLLNLRGGLLLDGRRVTDPRLVRGATLSLATGLDLHILDVHLPTEAWALQLGTQHHPIEPVLSLLPTAPHAVARRLPDALRTLWSDGDQVYDGEQPLAEGATVQWADQQATLTRWQRPDAQGHPTQQRRQGALTAYARFHSVDLHDAGALVLTVRGGPARILHELVEIGGPVSWSAIAEQMWTDGPHPSQLRRRWDAVLSRLRRQLATAGLHDLVVSDGCGHVDLVRRPGDRFVVDG